MPIPLTTIHKRRIIGQIETNLTNLQANMNANAKADKAKALAQSEPLDRLQAYCRGKASEYLRRLQWVIDLRGDPVRRQRMLDMLATVGWTEAEIVNYVTSLRSAAVALRDASISTYAEVAAACDAVLTAVDAPDSLWPE